MAAEVHAKDLMSKQVESVDKDDRLESVLDRMRKHRMSKMVVLEKGNLVGIITDGDISDELGALKNRGIPAAHLHASSAMRRQFASCTPDSPWHEVLRLMLKSDTGIVPVVHDKNVLGVVTASDLLKLVTSKKTVDDVMTRTVHGVEATDRVVHARRLMVDHHIERLPVLQRGKVVGIVGEIDIALGFARFKVEVADKHQTSAITRFLVEDIMRPTVITTTPDVAATAAAAKMMQEDVGCLPVVRDDHIVGIVTRSDLLKTIELPKAK